MTPILPKSKQVSLVCVQTEKGVLGLVPMYPNNTKTEESNFDSRQKKLWNTRAEADLIEYLKLYPELWDPDNPDFRRISIKTHLYNKIAHNLRASYPHFANEIDYDCVHRKVNILKSYYRKEIKKMKVRPSYNSSWEHFSRLSFLGNTPERELWIKRRKKDSEKFPTVIRVPRAQRENNSELDTGSNNSSDPDSSMNINEMMNLEQSTTEPSSLLQNTGNTDEAFGQFITCLLKSVPESKKKDDVRMKIIQDLIKCKNS